MLGNVSEWAADLYSDSYYQSSPLSNPIGPDFNDDGTQVVRAVRGASWYFDYYQSSLIGSAYRKGVNSQHSDSLIGFRCARTAETDSNLISTGVPTSTPLMSLTQIVVPITFTPNQINNASGVWVELNSENSGKTATEICQSNGFALATKARQCDGAILVFLDEYSHSNCKEGATTYQDCFDFSSCIANLPKTVVFESLYCELPK